MQTQFLENVRIINIKKCILLNDESVEDIIKYTLYKYIVRHSRGNYKWLKLTTKDSKNLLQVSQP